MRRLPVPRAARLRRAAPRLRPGAAARRAAAGSWCSSRSCRRSSTRRRSSPASATCATTCARSRLLAFGLVIATTRRRRDRRARRRSTGLSWAAAFTLGAIVSPTDALAATEVARRLSLPRRVVSILEGESLVNDGLALVIYKYAVAAAVAGTFSLWNASWHLVLNVVGGIARRSRCRVRRAAGEKARRRPADGGGDRAPLRATSRTCPRPRSACPACSPP